MNASLKTGMTLDEHLNLEYPFNVTPDEDDGGYVIEFPDLPGCMTQIDSLDELPAMAEEARTLWIETAYEGGMAIPSPTYPEPYSGRFNVRLPQSLHRRLVESAGRDGVSLNQFVVHLLSESVALCSIESRLQRLEAEVLDKPSERQEADEHGNPLGAFLANPRSIFSDPD